MGNRLPLALLSCSIVGAIGCGGGGTVAVAADAVAAGLTWRSEASGVSDPLVAIDGSAGNLWIASSHGVVHGNGDGSWEIVERNDDEEYRALLVDGDDVYVAGMPCRGGVCEGGVVACSSDGGRNWQRTTFARAAAGLSGDGHEVYLVLDGELRVASDGFISARPVPLPAARGIHAGDGKLLAFGGIRDLMIFASGDGGGSWATAYDVAGGSKSGHVDAMWGAGEIMLAVGNGASVPATKGVVLRSSDGGTSWRALALPAMERATSVWGATASDVYVLGSQLLHSRDSVTFSTVTLPDGAWQVVWGTSARDLYVIGSGSAILHGTR
jgi:hypothetical protein